MANPVRVVPFRNFRIFVYIKQDKMAKPIKETPILRGEDAQRFVKEIEKAEKEKVSSETAK